MLFSGFKTSKMELWAGLSRALYLDSIWLLFELRLAIIASMYERPAMGICGIVINSAAREGAAVG